MGMIKVIDKSNPISVRSKRLITEALLELMETVPFSKISIRDIVEKAGLTRQTFYHNFESKEDVVSYKLDELFEGFFQYVIDNKVADCEGVICFYFRYWQKNDKFIKLLVKNNLVYILELKYPEYFKVIQFIFMRGNDISDVESEYVYSFISGAIINLLVTWINNGQVMTPKEMAKFVMRILEGTFYELHIPSTEKESRIEIAAALKNSTEI